MRLDRKVALVTGAGSGIGAALAEALARRGATLVLVGRREERLRALAARLGPGAVVATADVTRPEDRAALRRRIAARFRRLDVLVNNAGVVPVGPVAAVSDEEIARTLAVNLVAPLALVREFLPLLAAGAPSRIVNVGSMFGEIAFPLFGLYSATKFGLKGLSDALRRELARDGIGVTHAAPRATRTPAAAGFAALVPAFRMRVDEPAAVAERIAAAIERDRSEVWPRGPERLVTFVQRLLPRLVDRAIMRQLEGAAGARAFPPARAGVLSSEENP